MRGAPKDGQPSYVVVELKQWSTASLLEDSVDLCVVPAYGGARLHPGEQVRRYCGHLGDSLAALAELDDPLAGVAYLHNATDLDVAELFRLPDDEQGRLFTGQRRAEFLDYLRGRLAPASGAEAADRLLGSAVRPSRQLLALAADEVQRREMFRPQDQQQAAYRLVLRALERARRGFTKQAIVVVGGPGSGKSAIALSLLGELDGQYRCGGSRAYETWVLRLLGLEPGGPMGWEGDEHFAVQLAESAEHMEEVLRRHQSAGYSARISAGYCWPWGDPHPDGSLPEDAVVGNWRRPWNNKRDTSVGGPPGRPFFRLRRRDRHRPDCLPAPGDRTACTA